MKSFNRPVSVIALRGGFGNQLFAWAYGQALQNLGHVVRYDPGPRLGRGFALEGLVPARSRLQFPAAFWRRVHYLDSPFFKRLRIVVHKEDQTQAPSNIFVNPGVTFHWGYWQSSDYFVQAREQIAAKLVRWLNIDGDDKLRECAVHVRRGDYVSDPDAAAVMGTLPMSYYRSAIDHMKALGFSRFVVYSDDKEWASANLLPLDAQISMAQSHPSSDFVNMSKSSALITANSSFSWWAAFVASSSGSEVVAPKRWFADETLHSNRVAPETWTTI